MNQKDVAAYIESLKKKKHVKLKIKGSVNDSPSPIRYYNSKKLFIPDVVITYKNKRDYYSFETKISIEDISILTFKWILFAAEARKLNGQFHLVVDKKHFEMCRKVIIEKQLEIILLKL